MNLNSSCHPFIRYVQDSIRARFNDGIRLETTFRQLLFDKKNVSDIDELIEVVKDKDGIYWALNGNRRLFLFKILLKYGMVSVVKVKERDLSKPETQCLLKERMTTKPGDEAVVVRGEPGLEQKLEQIGREWKEKQDKKFSAIFCAPLITSPIDIIDYPLSDYDDHYDPLPA